MKKLSDYKGEEAIELWVDLFDEISAILSDKEIAKIVKSGDSTVNIAKKILKLHGKEAVAIMERIDGTPVDGLNIVLRLVGLLTEIGQNEEMKSFFGYAEQAKTE